jgi:hypothetical protein
MKDERHRTGTVGSGTRTIREAVETFSTDRNQTHHERWTMDLIAEAWAACASLMCR